MRAACLQQIFPSCSNPAGKEEGGEKQSLVSGSTWSRERGRGGQASLSAPPAARPGRSRLQGEMMGAATELDRPCQSPPRTGGTGK